MNSVTNEIEQKSVTIHGDVYWQENFQKNKLKMLSISNTFFRCNNHLYEELDEVITKAKPSTFYGIYWDK